MPSVRIKGQSFVGFQRTLDVLHGDGSMKKVKDRLSRELVSALENREILPMGWYPIRWYADLHATARALFGPQVSREIGRSAARDDINTIYRSILRFFSPETLLSQSKRVFALFADSGSCKVDETRRGFARLRYDGCNGANQGLWENILGSTETMVELCGGRAVGGKIVDGGRDGDHRMTSEISWVAR